MRPRLPLPPKTPELLLTLCALSLAFGCADEGGSVYFPLADHFEPQEATVEERPGDTLLRMDGIGFSTGTADLTPASLLVLDKFVTVFEALPGARYSIEAHTDSAGNEYVNQALTEERAEAVRDYLVDVLGAPAVAFTTIGHGEYLPIATNKTKAGRALNRRVEIIVQDDTGDPIFRVMLAAERIDVTLDCDAFTSSAAAAAGDFYIQTEFYSDDDRGQVLAARTPNTLVLADDGEIHDLTIVAEGLFLTSDDAILNGFVDWFENDSGGEHQFDFTEEIRLRYDRRFRCWLDLDVGGGCISPQDGEIAGGTLSVVQPATSANHACIADLGWSLRVERVAR